MGKGKQNIAGIIEDLKNQNSSSKGHGGQNLAYNGSRFCLAGIDRWKKENMCYVSSNSSAKKNARS
jgi:hypothetical protein